MAKEINKSEWVQEKDEELLRLTSIHGKKWAKIAKYMKNGRNKGSKSPNPRKEKIEWKVNTENEK